MNSEGLLRALLGGFLQGAVAVWPAWLLLGTIFAAKVAFRLWERQRLAGSGIEEIDRMDGRTFEKYLEALFTKLGYRVELTKYVGDYGADLVVRKEGVKTVIQAKRHRRSVGVKAVQEAVAARGFYGCDAAMVVTNNRYTRQAVELARANGVTLWDRERLVAVLLSVKESGVSETLSPGMAAPAPLAPAQVAPAAPPPAEAPPDRCTVCGKVVSEKVRAFCAERPERFGGQVYCYDHQRSIRG